MPKRLIRDWTDSTRMDGVSAEGERLFMRLLMKADDFGRFHAEPRMIKGICFPLLDNLRTEHIGRWLDELSHHKLIFLYEVEGRGSFLAIPKFGQRLKESRAKFPPPLGEPENWLADSGAVATPSDFRELPGTSGKFPPEEKRRDTDKKGSAEGRAAGPVFPDSASLEYRAALTDWWDYKRERGQSYLPKGWGGLLSSLAKHPEARAVAAIRHSIASNYAGLFPDSVNGGKPAAKDPYHMAPE